MSYKPEAGYAYKRMRGEWVDVMLSERDVAKARFVGFREIDGNRMGVFLVGRSTIAQLAQNLVRVGGTERAVGKKRAARRSSSAKRKRMPSKPQYTSLGSYTIVYYDKRGDVMCAKCASKHRRDVKGSGTYDEGPPLECERCGREIESSYGEVESARGVGRAARRRHMTRADAVRAFRADILPAVRARYSKSDKPAAREAWNNYVDGLHKDGLISERQADTWASPVR